MRRSVMQMVRGDVDNEPGKSMAKSLQIIATLVATPGNESALRDALSAAVPAFRAENGCEAYVLLEDERRPGRFMTYETWADEAALAEHMKSPTMASLAPKMKVWLEGEIVQDFLRVLVQR